MNIRIRFFSSPEPKAHRRAYSIPMVRHPSVCRPSSTMLKHLLRNRKKIAFNNARSLHKHFRDVESEPNVLEADAIGFAETRLCRRDENVHYALKRFRLIRLDDAEKESGNRPYHGLALYVKEYFQIQKVVTIQCISFEFIFAGIYSIQRGYVQVVLYKYPRSSQTDFRKDFHHHLRPVIDLNAKLVILSY